MSRNTLLYIEENNRVALDPGGELVDAWTRFAVAFFEVETLSGSESQVQMSSEATSSHKMSCAFIRGVNPRMRLRDPNATAERIFNVQSVVNVNEDNRELLWLVTEVV